MLGMLLNFIPGRVKLMSYSSYRRASEECEGKAKEAIILT